MWDLGREEYQPNPTKGGTRGKCITQKVWGVVEYLYNTRLRAEEVGWGVMGENMMNGFMDDKALYILACWHFMYDDITFTPLLVCPSF